MLFYTTLSTNYAFYMYSFLYNLRTTLSKLNVLKSSFTQISNLLNSKAYMYIKKNLFRILFMLNKITAYVNESLPRMKKSYLFDVFLKGFVKLKQ